MKIYFLLYPWHTTLMSHRIIRRCPRCQTSRFELLRNCWIYFGGKKTSSGLQWISEDLNFFCGFCMMYRCIVNTTVNFLLTNLNPPKLSLWWLLANVDLQNKMSTGIRDPAQAWPASTVSLKLQKWHNVTSEAVLYVDQGQKVGNGAKRWPMLYIHS